MKTKFRLTMALGIITAAIVTAEVPLGNQAQGERKASEKLAGCYSEQEVTLLMEAGHYQREQAVELLELACENVITPN